MLRKQINGTTLRGTDGIDRTLNAVTLSEDEKKKVGELDFLSNDVLLADGVKAVAANDKVGLTEEEVSKGLKEGKWLCIREGLGKTNFGNGSIIESDAYIASGTNAHAEGSHTRATGDYSHAEGQESIADGNCAHSEGYNTNASGKNSHAEGDSTTTTTAAEHAEGKYNYSKKDMFISTIGVGSVNDRQNGVAVSVDG